MRVVVLACALCWTSTCLAAVPAGDLSDLDALPLHVAPPAATAKAIEAAQDVKGSGPALFAVTVPLPVDLAGGVWDEPEAGVSRWRTRVYSAGAQSLLMEFARFRVPEEAALWIYDAGGHAVQGPYDARNHTADGSLWTAMVPGETAVIELQVPTRRREDVELHLGRLGHAYRNAAQLGDSGACNIDAVCPLGDAWREESRSVVKVQVPVTLGFVGLCSGTLVNNTAQDDRPFILTADHCGIGRIGSPASGVVVYWNFQNSACGVDNAPDDQAQSGATLRARDRDTDLSLIELNQPPSAAFNVYYAGWDASGAGGNSGVSIHHPSGDAKKISEFTAPLVAANVQITTGGPQIPAWEVRRWAQGTTEEGSSGSGLWNQNRRIVGVLSGGSAACEGNIDNDEPDFYARLERQWTAGAEPSAQLKAWLDPTGSGCRAIGGKNPGSAAPAECSDGSSGGGGGGALGLSLLLALLALCRYRIR